MQPPDPTDDKPVRMSSEAPTPPPPPPPSLPPTTPPHDPHRWAVLMGIVGTFLATLLGVLAAQLLADDARRRADNESYGTLLRVIHLDCRQALEKNRRLRGASQGAPITQAAFLYVGSLQNALLFRSMEPERLESFVAAISDAAAAEAQYTHLRMLLPPPDAEEYPPSGATDEEKQEFRARVAAARHRASLDLDKALENYLSKQETLCQLLAPSR